jgi:molybdopterin-containing oxidoreductase family iron-sulfur binding subunit
MDRREFLEFGGGFVLAAGSCGTAIRLLTTKITRTTKQTSDAIAEDRSPPKKWGMVIDVTKCRSDCTACLEACKKENNVAHHGDDRWDVHWIRKVGLKKKGDEHARVKPVILLCNHCDNPPCAQVCPVQATYKRPDGIVIVDYHRCIGCRYCLIACPYNARNFNFKASEVWPNEGYPRRTHGVAEACTLCAHLLDAGQEPACVVACRETGAAAITVGDLNDPESDVSKLIKTNSVQRIRADLGTAPKVYYIGL